MNSDIKYFIKTTRVIIGCKILSVKKMRDYIRVGRYYTNAYRHGQPHRFVGPTCWEYIEYDDGNQLNLLLHLINNTRYYKEISEEEVNKEIFLHEL